MHISFSEVGDLVITPDNATERFALRAWIDQRSVNAIPPHFVIDLTPQPAAPSKPTNPDHVKRF